ncbi:NK-tumor recognition protein isoform X2 [Hippocampus comes]|uniref:NK-tumor recognition protein isoform X2 n=1 Tax=Hippocampus comes TaxID=109280 RepID=UPI00094EE1EE|nr:PREDICTED: NK-tumor recognition protein isoform X2 [Hippocampus comes]
MGVKDRPQCYFDVELNREPVGRIVFQLFSDICPKTSKNFLCLCTGEKGAGKITGKKLCYKGSTFHRVVKNFMIQGGDFTEGNGRGGESIYGGYFEDENLTLKHDRAFLLSMANRGKDTNGSQFFITTKMAPHLDGVHVVFGLVISGFEVIKKIEGLKTDSASRPYADVRVVDCGQLIVKSANDVLEGKRVRASHSADSSLNSSDSSSLSSSSEESESDSERSTRRKHKRHGKNKRSKKRRRPPNPEKTVDLELSKHSSHHPAEEEIGDANMEDEKEHSGKREKPVVRPEEIPPVPENRFLLRQDTPAQENKAETVDKQESTVEAEPKPAVSKSGRKIRGRGTIRYHTPTRSKSRSASVGERGSSETPPHWKEEMMRTKAYQPPSVERWSKGDQWDKRSETAWSRSSERSSGRSSEMSSPPRLLKKEKKRAKHKKKAKKRKRGKKRSSRSKHQDGERSPSSRRLNVRTPRSSSSRRYTRGRSSVSRSRSRSRISSRSRSRARSYSYSRSRSLSRSRSGSRSRSRCRSYSRSRSRHRSASFTPSRKRSLSRSPRKGKSRADAPVHLPGKLSDSKVTPASRMLTVPVPENVPVIPLSDSPPPSRWKPGQKPWKSSYIQPPASKAQIAPVNVSSMGQAASENAPSSVQETFVPSDSERAKHGARRSPSRSSPSKSDSRSRSRSASKSASGSRTSSRSDSAPSEPKKKKSLDKHWRKYYRSLKRIKHMDKYISSAAAHEVPSVKKAGVEPSPDKVVPKVGQEQRGSPDQETKKYSSIQTDSLVHKSGWDSDSDRVSQSNGDFLSKLQKAPGHIPDKKTSGLTGWNSESESESVATRPAALSEKEEGEASSESERETDKMPSSAGHADAAAPARASAPTAADPEKHKSKRKSKRKRKRKSRGEGKSGSRHARDKSKRPKKKRQKLKETFHWQPPLEFDEEEDEDDAKREKRSPVAAVVNKDRGVTSSNKNANKEESGPPTRAKESSHKSTKASEPRHQPSNRNGSDSCGAKEPNSVDAMDICTPEHDAAAAPEKAPKSGSRLAAKASKGALAQPQSLEPPPVAAADPDQPTSAAVHFKWRPLKGMALLQNAGAAQLVTHNAHAQQSHPASVQGVRMEIKSKNRVRPGSLFDEVRKTVRLNRRPGNRESSGEESSPSAGGTRGDSPRKSRSAARRSRSTSSQRSRTRDWSQSYSRSGSRSRSSSYSSRGRSRSRRRHVRQRSRSSTYGSYRSHSRTYSRSHTRSPSYNYRSRRSRSASSDSYSSRSRSGSRTRGRHRSHSYRSPRRGSRSSRSSSRSWSRRRSRSRSSRYS